MSAPYVGDDAGDGGGGGGWMQLGMGHFTALAGGVRLKYSYWQRVFY
jgi:hypothetical protein